MANDANKTPSFDLPPPEVSRDTGLEARIRRRMFGEAAGVELEAVLFERYELLRRLGEGGMGVVHAARDPELERVVALKRLRGGARSLSREARERLIAEAKTLAKLAHPNVVAVYEAGEHEGEVYISMEFVEGQTLLDWQGQAGRTRAEILAAYRQAGAGLAAAHARGIIHRDFKANNVLVGEDGRARVADFGLATTPEPAQTEPSQDPVAPTSAGATRVAGTPGYIAPELYAGHPADASSDQFAFCVALWEALAGVRPHPPERLSQRSGPLPAPAGSPSPAWLRRVLLRGLDADPAQRWPDLDALLHALDRRPRRLLLAALGLLAGGGLIGALAGSTLFDREPEACADPSERFDAVWSEPRARALETRSRSLAPDWGERLAERLAATRRSQRDAWIQARRSSCAALVQSPPELRLLHLADQACLDRHLARAETLLELLESGDAEVFARLDDQLEVLGDPQACLDQDSPRQTLPLHLASVRAALEADLDDTALHLAAGHYREAEALSTELVDRARALGQRAPLSEALALRGRAAQRRLDGPGAREHLYAAYLEAMPEGDAAQLYELRSRLADVHINLLEDPAHGQEWRDQARASFVSLEPERAARIHGLDADLALARADHDGALVALEAAREAAREAAVPLSAETFQFRLADVLAERGEGERAVAEYTRLVEARRARLGAGHPDVARVEFNLGLTHLELGQAERAVPVLEGSLEHLADRYGSDSLGLASHRVALATAHDQLGDPDRTLGLAATALVDDPNPGAYTTRANAMRLAGWSSFQTWRLRESFVLYEALAAEKGAALDPSEAAGLAETLGWLACRLGRHSEAKALLEGALAASDPAVRLRARISLLELRLIYAEPEGVLAEVNALRADPALDSDVDPGAAGELDALAARALTALDPDNAQLSLLRARSLSLLQLAGMGPLHAELLALPLSSETPRE